MEIKNLDAVDCPYCTMQTLEPIDFVSILAYDGAEIDVELATGSWVACRCSTCFCVTVLDKNEIERS